MTRVGLIYFSKTGVTARLAAAIKSGVEGEGNTQVLEHRIEGAEIIEGRFVNEAIIDQLGACEAIIFGSPTYMGGVSAQFKAFADATSELWCDQLWAGKIAAGFTCGSAVNGDQSGTLHYMATLASQQGMIWAGLDSANGYTDRGVNRLGCQLGVVAHSVDEEAHPADLATAHYLGSRVARLTLGR